MRLPSSEEGGAFGAEPRAVGRLRDASEDRQIVAAADVPLAAVDRDGSGKVRPRTEVRRRTNCVRKYWTTPLTGVPLSRPTQSGKEVNSTVTRLRARISSLLVRDKEEGYLRGVEAYLRVVDRPSAPWPSGACPLGCESIMPETHPGPSHRRSAAHAFGGSRAD